MWLGFDLLEQKSAQKPTSWRVTFLFATIRSFEQRCVLLNVALIEIYPALPGI